MSEKQGFMTACYFEKQAEFHGHIRSCRKGSGVFEGNNEAGGEQEPRRG